MLSYDEIDLLKRFIAWLIENDMNPAKDAMPDYLIEMFDDETKPELDESETDPPAVGDAWNPGGY